uniref:Uncharacterized protein n=1 Tax=Romanomermis culicivorax TaxID=13658 RepID=A0A915J3K5_ROMCU
MLSLFATYNVLPHIFRTGNIQLEELLFKFFNHDQVIMSKLGFEFEDGKSCYIFDILAFIMLNIEQINNFRENYIKEHNNESPFPACIDMIWKPKVQCTLNKNTEPFLYKSPLQPTMKGSIQQLQQQRPVNQASTSGTSRPMLI